MCEIDLSQESRVQGDGGRLMQVHDCYASQI